MINILLYQTLGFNIHEKLEESYMKLINLKYQHGMKSLNYLMDLILYRIFKMILNLSQKNMRQLLIILQ